jgi:acetylornithine/succinyldiaminopimelate/putrescine aminotransferase
MVDGFPGEALALAVGLLDTGPEVEVGDLLGVGVVPTPLGSGALIGVLGVVGRLGSEPVWLSGTLTATSGTVALTCGTVALTSGTAAPTPGTVTLGTVKPTLGTVKPTLGTDTPSSEPPGAAKVPEARAWPPPAARMAAPKPATDTPGATAVATALFRQRANTAEERVAVVACLCTRLGEVDRGAPRLGLHPDIVHEGGHQRKPASVVATRARDTGDHLLDTPGRPCAHRPPHRIGSVPKARRLEEPLALRPVMAADPQLLRRLDSLGVVSDAEARADETLDLAARHLDPSLVDVLGILGFDKGYVSAQGSYLYDAEGRAYLDFHSGEGFASLGHNHPDVREVLQATLAADLLDGVQIHYSPLAGMLAEALCERLPQGLDAVFFASTGAEAVDSAMKFARAATGRPRLISCESSFHGVTLGPLSLVGDDFFKEGFGPLLPGCARVPFGDLERLEAELRAKDVAAFIVEPIQGRMVTLPPEGYLRGAQELCRRYGTKFVLDEIQTGLGRTGRWFALEQWGLEPDFVLVGKALSGGYMPVAAMVTRREIFQKAVGTLERSYVHQSTYGRNRLSMAAGLATLRIIERDGLLEHTARVGGLLRDGLLELQGRYEMIKEIRASGLMIGIELGAPSTPMAKLNWRLIHMASEGLFPQLIVIPLHRDHGVITMAAGKNDVIKLLPPLTLSESEAASFLEALDAVLAECQGSSSKNLAVVRDIATTTLRRRARTKLS